MQILVWSFWQVFSDPVKKFNLFSPSLVWPSKAMLLIINPEVAALQVLRPSTHIV